MDKKRKLGRSLDEVADFWLSSTQITTEKTASTEDTIPSDVSKGKHAGFTQKTFSILYPESPKVKVLILTNIALEFAKQGYGSCILDYETKGSPLSAMMGDLFHNLSNGEGEETQHASHKVLRLYGLPSIHVFSRKGEDLPSARASYKADILSRLEGNNLLELFILLNHKDDLETITEIKDLPAKILLVTRPRKESLLISYAYIKALLSKNPDTRIWMVMDEVSDKDEAIKAFTMLDQIVLHRLSHQLKFLGSIVHDQALSISIDTHSPLVLSEKPSAAKESLTRITTNLLNLIQNTA